MRAPIPSTKSRQKRQDRANLASQLWFELFCNDKRQEVALAMASNKTLTDEIADGAFSSAVDGELTKMWSKLPKAYREEYVAASKEAR